jgi:hypothetical protein
MQPNMFHHADGLILVVDKGYRDRDTETWLNDRGITVVRPAYRGEPARPGRGLLRSVRQSIESVNETFKGQLDHTADAPSPALPSGSCNASWP